MLAYILVATELISLGNFLTLLGILLGALLLGIGGMLKILWSMWGDLKDIKAQLAGSVRVQFDCEQRERVAIGEIWNAIRDNNARVRELEQHGSPMIQVETERMDEVEKRLREIEVHGAPTIKQSIDAILTRIYSLELLAQTKFSPTEREERRKRDDGNSDSGH